MAEAFPADYPDDCNQASTDPFEKLGKENPTCFTDGLSSSRDSGIEDDPTEQRQADSATSYTISNCKNIMVGSQNLQIIVAPEVYSNWLTEEEQTDSQHVSATDNNIQHSSNIMVGHHNKQIILKPQINVPHGVIKEDEKDNLKEELERMLVQLFSTKNVRQALNSNEYEAESSGVFQGSIVFVFDVPAKSVKRLIADLQNGCFAKWLENALSGLDLGSSQVKLEITKAVLKKKSIACECDDESRHAQMDSSSPRVAEDGPEVPPSSLETAPQQGGELAPETMLTLELECKVSNENSIELDELKSRCSELRSISSVRSNTECSNPNSPSTVREPQYNDLAIAASIEPLKSEPQGGMEKGSDAIMHTQDARSEKPLHLVDDFKEKTVEMAKIITKLTHGVHPQYDKDLMMSDSNKILQAISRHVCDICEASVLGQENAINVAVAGSSGTGKSTFINTLRHLTAHDLDAAPVGVSQMPKDQIAYILPQNKEIVFWDFLSDGTRRIFRKSKQSAYNLDKYDFFVIISCSRFTEEDHWLAKEAASFGKPIFFVRSKLDEDIENDLICHPRSHMPEEVEKQIRMDCRGRLSRDGFTQPDIFLISNYDITKYDFPKMMESFFECLPKEKKNLWRLSMCPLSEAAVREKRSILQNNVWLAAMASSRAAAVPVHGLSICIDMSFLGQCQNYYIKQFGLDDKTLQRTVEISGKTIHELKSKIPLYNKLVQGGITLLVKQFAESEVNESVARFIPLVGGFVSSSISFTVAYAVLNHILDTCEAAAIDLLKGVTDDMK